MNFVKEASTHQWCDLVFDTMDGPTNQQEGCPFINFLVQYKWT